MPRHMNASLESEILQKSLERNFTQQAIREIEDTYGDKVRIKSKIVLKFGRDEDSTTTGFHTVWLHDAGNENETFVSSNIIDTISSSSTSDTAAVKIEGHTIDGNGDFTFVVQSATLNGQNKVVLTTPLARCSRIYNDNSVNWVGNIYVYEDDTVTAGVPNTVTKVHMKADPTRNQSEKGSTTFSKLDYAIITQATAGVTTKTDATAEFQLQVREKGKVFRTRANFSASQSSFTSYHFQPYLVVPPNSDVRIISKATASNTEVIASFNSLLAIKI